MSITTNGWDETGQAIRRFELRLFVAGASANSVRAIANLRAICEEHMPGMYDLEVIDIHQERILAEREQIIALPLLIKSLPLPERRMIGDMSNKSKVLKGLGLI